jgi:6-phosphogluconolactonase
VRLIRAADAREAAALAPSEIASACRSAVTERGVAVIAVSGGETPWRMLERLRSLDLPWQQLYVAQVDERVAPRGDPRRNLTRLEQMLVAGGSLPHAHLLAMPVEADDLDAAAAGYQQRLEALAGRPLVLDLVQLGLGDDGHTASLVPGDPVLDVIDRDVAISRKYQGLPRMTLTLPALDRARRRLWLVTGAAKAARAAELLAGEAASDAPALRVTRAEAALIADEAALALATADPSRE